ncbi:hypothetical protein MTR_0035s0070 [Medicago truncatula]|uniref:Uncharacterized protein n=1 Tax=Medicago truncatula TaxID=3880 RepID=A0A072TIY9_MEDTR|nr:hypothetical protein MTR_0035s0070 [Medicago truncatula]
MDNFGVNKALSISGLRAPIQATATSERDIFVNSLKLRFRTYSVEFDPTNENSCLPGLLIEDFGSKLQPYILLIDPKLHKFESIVIKLTYNEEDDDESNNEETSMDDLKILLTDEETSRDGLLTWATICCNITCYIKGWSEDIINR